MTTLQFWRASAGKKEELTMSQRQSVMLGEISTRELHGPWSDFMNKLQTKEGREWFDGFKRFLRKQNPWPQLTPESFTRTIKVNRTRSPQDALSATGRVQYTDRKVVDCMPKGEGNEVEIVFFKPDLSNRNGFISDNDLEKEFELRGLKPVDPITLAALNEDDPAFADEKPHGTHWKNAQGNWCCATFRRWCGERRVGVRRGGDWRGSWWFVGVLASSSSQY